jgi:hypothetical protein
VKLFRRLKVLRLPLNLKSFFLGSGSRNLQLTSDFLILFFEILSQAKACGYLKGLNFSQADGLLATNKQFL